MKKNKKLYYPQNQEQTPVIGMKIIYKNKCSSILTYAPTGCEYQKWVSACVAKYGFSLEQKNIL